MIKEYREIVKEELERGICWCCKGLFSALVVHHIDKNQKNNKRDNLLCVCKKCHSYIHKGFNKNVRSLNKEQIQRILSVRKELLRRIYKKDIDDYLKYEFIIATQIPLRKDRCYYCGEKKNITFIKPSFIDKFDKKNIRRLGIPICKKCKISI